MQIGCSFRFSTRLQRAPAANDLGGLPIGARAVEHQRDGLSVRPRPMRNIPSRAYTRAREGKLVWIQSIPAYRLTARLTCAERIREFEREAKSSGGFGAARSV
jgi:hypothetical protein